jgi:hypothetical protein
MDVRAMAIGIAAGLLAACTHGVGSETEIFYISPDGAPAWVATPDGSVDAGADAGSTWTTDGAAPVEIVVAPPAPPALESAPDSIPDSVSP